MSGLISRRKFIVLSAAGLMSAHPLHRLLAANIFSAEGAPRRICASYLPDYSAPWSQSPARLSRFLSGDHLEFDVGGWFLFGNLREESGKNSGFFMGIQRMDQDVLGERVPVYQAAIGFNHPELGRYLYGGCDITDLKNIVITQNPWKVHAVCPGESPGWMSMELLSGKMGRPNATYLLKAHLTDQYGERLQARVTLRDRMGAVQHGYGPASFYPQWLTPLQRSIIRSEFHCSVDAYLQETAAPMKCQGEYYYSLGLMDVQRFEIGVGSASRFAAGNSGTFWMDYCLETLNEAFQSVIKDSEFVFFALQFPSRREAMMVFQLDTKTAGRLNVARRYKVDSATARNGALLPIVQWDYNKIHIWPLEGTRWKSEETGLTYPMKYFVWLNGPSKAHKGELLLQAVRHNQELVIENSVQYQGLYRVQGTLGGEMVRGQAWVEIQPPGHMV
ncbi:MAG: hypothetical protein C4567_12605 [Deltaproteobacteria bacterium]|nr:MAG: hypothetical protein C4567_12605 [Deltaproteobacteria bacterium]